MSHRIVLPIGTDVSVFDPEDAPDSMPIYEGDTESAFMSLEPGLYPFTFDLDEYTKAVEGLPHGGGPIQCVLIVTSGESFAVSTAVEYDVVHVIEPTGSGPF